MIYAMRLAGWQLTAGGLALLPVTLLFEDVPATIDAAALTGYAWLGLVGGLLTYTLWFSGIGRLPVASVAVLGLLSPLVAAALGALLLEQNLGVLQMVGFALALTAITAGQFTPRKEPAHTTTAPTNIATSGVDESPMVPLRQRGRHENSPSSRQQEWPAPAAGLAGALRATTVATVSAQNGAAVGKHGQHDPEPGSGLGGGRLGAAWGVTPDVPTGVERRGLEP